MKSNDNFARTNSISFKTVVISLITILAVLAGGCSHDTPPVEGAAMYFWRTVFRLDAAERQFIEDHNIRTLYIRFFDVDLDGESSSPMPKATLAFADSLPLQLRYVPVVFIVNDCFRENRPDLAEKILSRIMQISETNGLAAPDELQIDCDWTRSTRENFFSFMETLHAEAQKAGLRVSVTVRLHQLPEKAPEADYGVLMVYNTGSLRDSGTTNPILSRDGVEPYLRYLKSYSLPLCSAFPNFRWNVLYTVTSERKLSYLALLYGCNPEDHPSIFKRVGKDEWLTTGSMQFTTAIGASDNLIRVTPGMVMKQYGPPSADDLVWIEQTLATKRKGIEKCIVLFDLSPENIKIFSKSQYEKIFNP